MAVAAQSADCSVARLVDLYIIIINIVLRPSFHALPAPTRPDPADADSGFLLSASARLVLITKPRQADTQSAVQWQKGPSAKNI